LVVVVVVVEVVVEVVVVVTIVLRVRSLRPRGPCRTGLNESGGRLQVLASQRVALSTPDGTAVRRSAAVCDLAKRRHDRCSPPAPSLSVARRSATRHRSPARRQL